MSETSGEKRAPVMRSPRADAERRADGLFEPADMQRDRPTARAAAGIPGRLRRLEVVCGNGRHLLAVVHPRTGSVDAASVTSTTGRRSVGVDLDLPCPCGHLHQLDGGKLRAELLANDPKRRARVEVSALTKT